MKPDVVVENHGSLFLVRPNTVEARKWLKIHTAGQWFGGALVAEPRYVEDLVEGMEEEGFNVVWT